jgi:hypothetical protein
MDYVIPTPVFNLPSNLYQRLLTEIDSKQYIPAFNFNADTIHGSNSWLFKLWQKYSFKKGTFQTYRLSQETENLVLEHYRKFIDYVGLPHIIRYKSIAGVRWLFPHSDLHDYSDIGKSLGASVSIYIGLHTNKEITNWYSFSGNRYSVKNVFNLLKLTKKKSFCLGNQESCLFDNASVHSVTNCSPDKERWCMAISWPGVPFEVIAQKYTEYMNDNPN